MDESCVAGTPSYDATDLTSIINGEDLSFFVPDSKGLISKGNFICAKVLLAGVDAATAAYEYEMIAESPATGMSIAELGAPTLAQMLKQVGGGGCPSELKGSIGEGPNHSNFSDRSSVRILGVRSEFFQNSGIFARKFKNLRKFQHFLKYRRNSDKISSKSEQILNQ